MGRDYNRQGVNPDGTLLRITKQVMPFSSRISSPSAILLTLAFLPAPAFAADQTVTATPTNQFMPGSVTLTVGEKVTWNNGGGTHNVHFDDNSFVEPPTASATAWSVSRTFTVSGSFRYYCDFHGFGMSGTVNVNSTAPGASPPPFVPPPGGGTSPPALADSVAPELALASRKSQRVLTQRGLRVTAESDEPATLRAGASVNVPGARKTVRFRSVTVELAAGVERAVKLRLSRKSLRTVRRALRRGVRLFARVRVSAEDSSGNLATARRRIRLRS
jgi:plastocyanin